MVRKLGPGTLRDTKWQEEEYRRQMGDAAAERQRVADCDCEPQRVFFGRAPRIVHAKHCRKFRAWMEGRHKNAAAHASAAAHADAIKRSAPPVSEERSG